MVSVQRFTEQIFSQYDYNRDGYLYIGNRGNSNESIRYSQKTQKGRYTDTLITSKHSHQALFNFADRDGDRFVTRYELYNVLSGFDMDQNGKISDRKGKHNVSEMGQFKLMYPETKEIVDRKIVYRNGNNPYNPRPWLSPKKPGLLSRLFGIGRSRSYGQVPYHYGQSGFVNRHIIRPQYPVYSY